MIIRMDMIRIFIESNMETENSFRLAVVSGTLLSIVPNIGSADIFRTILLAAIGTTVSFLMSVLFKAIMKNRKR